MFTGDVLFHQGLGHTGLPGGDDQALRGRGAHRRAPAQRLLRLNLTREDRAALARRENEDRVRPLARRLLTGDLTAAGLLDAPAGLERERSGSAVVPNV